MEGGENAAFLTIGDPLVYSTFGYLLRTLREVAPHLPVAIVPGITSFQAAAARTGTVLCEGGEKLRILPAVFVENVRILISNHLCLRMSGITLHSLDVATIQLELRKKAPA